MTDAPIADDRLSVGRVLRHTAELLRRSVARALIALALLVAPGLAIDTGQVSGDGESALLLLTALLPLVLQFWLTRALLADLGRHGSERPRFPAFFLAGLVATLGILAGLVLLVVPGVILFVRWSISAPILLGSDAGAIESLRLSWHETEGRFWPILGAFAAIYIPALLLALAAGLAQVGLLDPLAGIILFNLSLQAGIILGWYAAVAIYSLIDRPAALTRVFA